MGNGSAVGPCDPGASVATTSSAFASHLRGLGLNWWSASAQALVSCQRWSASSATCSPLGVTRTPSVRPRCLREPTSRWARAWWPGKRPRRGESVDIRVNCHGPAHRAQRVPPSDRLGWPDTFVPEHTALTQIQADAFICLASALPRAIDNTVTVASIDDRIGSDEPRREVVLRTSRTRQVTNRDVALLL